MRSFSHLQDAHVLHGDHREEAVVDDRVWCYLHATSKELAVSNTEEVQIETLRWPIVERKLHPLVGVLKHRLIESVK